MPIMVNKVEITDDEVHAEMQYHPSASVEEARYKSAQALVIRELLIQEAVRKGVLEGEVAAGDDGDVSVEEEEEAIDRLLQQEINVPEADEGSCRRYYQQNKERFVDRESGEFLPFEMVESYIRDYLHMRSMQAGIWQYIHSLADKADIVGFEMT